MTIRSITNVVLRMGWGSNSAKHASGRPIRRAVKKMIRRMDAKIAREQEK